MAAEASPPSGGPSANDHRYTVAGLRAYEAIYGRDFVSPGGRRTTAAVLRTVSWLPGWRVLDVGCGLGGAAFMMVREHRATVVGVDVSANMIEQATLRSEAYGLQEEVTLVHGDIMTLDMGRKFDLVHSREVFLHVHDKQLLFGRLRDMLEPGGQLLFTDYCRGSGRSSAAFDAYVEEFGYDLRPVEEIATLLVESGFTDVVASDETEQFIEIHERERKQLADDASGLTEIERDDLRTRWLAKVDRARAGEQRWGWFRAVR